MNIVQKLMKIIIQWLKEQVGNTQEESWEESRVKMHKRKCLDTNEIDMWMEKDGGAW